MAKPRSPEEGLHLFHGWLSSHGELQYLKMGSKKQAISLVTEVTLVHSELRGYNLKRTSLRSGTK